MAAGNVSSLFALTTVDGSLLVSSGQTTVPIEGLDAVYENQNEVTNDEVAKGHFTQIPSTPFQISFNIPVA